MKPRYRVAHICVAICLLYVLFAGWYNHTLQLAMQEKRADIQRWKYTSSGYLPYDIGVPVEEMEFKETASVSSLENHGITISTSKVLFRLKRDIAYHSSPSRDEKPVLVRKKGEWVAVAAPSTGLNRGRGIKSYPTYDRNWRYAYPLPLENETWQTPGEHKLYVRLEDLCKLREDVAEERRYPQNIRANFSEVFAIGMSFLSEDDEFKKRWMLSQYLSDPYTFGSEAALLSEDTSLLRGGIYVSEDLKEPLWDIWNTVFLLGAILCFAFPYVRDFAIKRKKW